MAKLGSSDAASAIKSTRSSASSDTAASGKTSTPKIGTTGAPGLTNPPGDQNPNVTGDVRPTSDTSATQSPDGGDETPGQTDVTNTEVPENSPSKTAPIYNDPPVAPDRLGNRAENLNTGGIAAIQGEWIYYRNYTYSGYLYKVKTDGTGKTLLLANDVTDINVIDNWIYFQNHSKDHKIYKIRTDGTDLRHIGSSTTDSFVKNETELYVVGNWIYYLTDYNSIRRVKTDGTQDSLVHSAYSGSYNMNFYNN